MNPKLHTRVCDLLGCDLPIVLAGMGGVARAELVTAVSDAGGFGFLGMVRESPQLIRAEVAKVRAGTSRDFGVNLIPAATKPDLLEAEIATVLDLKVPVVALFWDVPAAVVRQLRASGVIVVYQVGSVEEAACAESAGAHILIAQGGEAGGHVRGLIPRDELLCTIAERTSLPVLAAGGIVNGRDLVNALTLGADGVVIGTALLATTESFAHDYHKKRIVAARSSETLLTQAFHVSWPRGANVRVLPNSVTRGEMGDPFTTERRVIGAQGERKIWLFSTDSPLRDMTGDFEKMALYAGAGCGEIDRIVSAGERIAAIMREAESLLSGRSDAATVGAANPSASPVCYAHETDDAYAGYASREELIAFCNTLLEAERAGARIAARTSVEAQNSAQSELMRDLHRDEAACCSMLLKWISDLGGEASRCTGSFYEKCLAIPEPVERIALINRGQGWVVRKLRGMLPKIRDDAMHADMKAILETHAQNIARADSFVRSDLPD